uniref:Ovule protein n=1 Tax=Hymenolepis diminuta TaxID=6216 RepID=A0A0R3SDG5_HYMDI
LDYCNEPSSRKPIFCGNFLPYFRLKPRAGVGKRRRWQQRWAIQKHLPSIQQQSPQYYFQSAQTSTSETAAL